MQALEQEVAGWNLPKVIVLDLDDCTWSPETYTLTDYPSDKIMGSVGAEHKEEACIGVQCGEDVLSLHPGALLLLQAVYTAKKQQSTPSSPLAEVNIAIASSADNSHAAQCAHKAFDMLEILPGVTLREGVNLGWSNTVLQCTAAEAQYQNTVGGHIWIGRDQRFGLSSKKHRSHFPRIKQFTQTEYRDMLFFDDSNWGDNCGDVERGCPGVVSFRTPHGLQVKDVVEGLKKYAKQYQS